MKKLLMIALVALLSVSLYSCSKNKSIDKTSWTNESQGEKTVLKFIDKTEVSITNTADGQTISLSGVYTYKSPNVSITILGSTAKGVVDGSKLSLTDPDDGSILVFTKD